jgi:DsbC/DsbD-like thiol-disulfide interchange protein
MKRALAGQFRGSLGRIVLCAMVSASGWPGAWAADGAEPALRSPWTADQASRARVIAGGVAPAGEASRIYAGLEIELDDGWKTYWRNPGSSGVPPRVDLEGSENLAKAELLFPAPLRFKDRDGDTIGYKKSVVLPVALTPKDPTKPIVLKVAAEFGICREVCIPVQPTLNLVVPPDAATAGPGSRLPEAVGRVPRLNASAPGAPRLERVSATLSGEKPKLVIDAVFPGDADRGDIFLEAPDGIWIPLPQPAGQAEDGARRFVVDLTDGADLADLKGKAIRMTLVGSVGQSETSFDLVEAH